MITTTTKYPFFDLEELIPELDLEFKAFKQLKPVKTGNYLPDLTLHTIYDRWQQFYNGAETHGPILLRHLLNKPLVISFYSGHWKNIGLEQLKQLNTIHNEIKANGGNLLVINAEKDAGLNDLAWAHSLSLSFYHDENNEIAKKLRIFSDEYPIWNTYSGIDANIPLPATYVIAPSRQIVFDHIDWDVTGSFPVKEVLAAVYGSALDNNRRRSA